jgi:hypothetical protein
MIYSVSIFSHLNIEDQAAWLKELARVTRPNGLCFLTTVGPHGLKIRSSFMGVDESSVLRQLEKIGFFFKEYADWRENVRHQDKLRITSIMVGVERPYGNAILSPDYIRRQWPAAGFEVRAVVEGIIHGQDLVVLRRL